MNNTDFGAVSIIMPVYNAEKYINEAVYSVLNQSYKNFELIAVDDCSTDNSYRILCDIAKNDDRVRVYKNNSNLGVSKTRNFGLSVACFKLIALIDSDDIWAYDKLEKQLALLSRYPDTGIMYTGCSFIDENSNSYDNVFQVPESICYSQLLKQNVISCSSVLIKKIYFEKYPMAGDNMHEDFATWLQVLKDGVLARGINEPLLIYRIAKNSKSGNKLKSAVMTYRVYKYIGLNPILRIYYMFVYTINGIKKYKKIK